MKKLKQFLWAVVLCYLAYAIYKEGFQWKPVVLMVLAILAVLLEIWKATPQYKKMRERYFSQNRED